MKIKILLLIIAFSSKCMSMDLANLPTKLHPQAPAAKKLYATAQQLIETNADLNAPIDNDIPLLAQSALHNNYLATTLLLLAHGANPDVIDHLGKTPLLYAAEACAHRVIRALVYYNANPNHRCYGARKNKITPLHALCSPAQDSFDPKRIRERQEAVEWLLAAGASTNAQDSCGTTPLFELVACYHGNKASILFHSARKELFFNSRKSLITAALACKANLETPDNEGRNLHTQSKYHVEPYLSVYTAAQHYQRRERLRRVLLTFLRTSPKMPNAQSPFKQVPPDILRYILKMCYP